LPRTFIFTPSPCQKRGCYEPRRPFGFDAFTNRPLLRFEIKRCCAHPPPQSKFFPGTVGFSPPGTESFSFAIVLNYEAVSSCTPPSEDSLSSPLNSSIDSSDCVLSKFLFTTYSSMFQGQVSYSFFPQPAIAAVVFFPPHAPWHVALPPPQFVGREARVFQVLPFKCFLIFEPWLVATQKAFVCDPLQIRSCPPPLDQLPIKLFFPFSIRSRGSHLARSGIAPFQT